MVLRLLTAAFWQAGNLPAAARTVRDWARVDTDRPTPERFASRIYEDMGAIELAEEAAVRAANRAPDDASAWQRLGRLRLRLMAKPGAISALERARRIGKAKVRREGNDLTIVTWGAMIYVADEAAAVLRAHGVTGVRVPADLPGTYNVTAAGFVHFDGAQPCTSGASNRSDRRRASSRAPGSHAMCRSSSPGCRPSAFSDPGTQFDA